MDEVIIISGLRFRQMPNVTVRMVLDAFRRVGKEGLLRRNGVIEYLEALIEFNTPYPYEFVTGEDLFSTSSTMSPQTAVRQRDDDSTVITGQPMRPFKRQIAVKAKKISPPLMITPNSYRIVELKAAEDKILQANQIEVFDKKGSNVSLNAILDSSTPQETYTHINLVNGEKNTPNNLYVSSKQGGWVRLNFANRDEIACVVITNKLEPEFNLNHTLSDATLTLRNVDEYVLHKELEYFTFCYNYQAEPVNFIEIRAPLDRFLILKEIVILDMAGERANELVTHFESSVFPNKDLSVQDFLLKDRSRDDDEYLTSSTCGGFVRMRLSSPTLIKSVTLDGRCLLNIKCLFERNYNFSCSSDTVQKFSIHNSE